MPELDGLVIRHAGPTDGVAIADLARSALGWDDDERHRSLYRWKHDDNPFGASPRWVAELDGEIVGLRVFLRWRFVRSSPNGQRTTAVAVRAVDTATRPDQQGRGIFRRLTTTAVDELRAEGIGFVFNTPNDQSRPGYLSMGWRAVGRTPLAVAPRGARSLTRLARARVPAELWSERCTAGDPAATVLTEPAIRALFAELPPIDRWSTDRDDAFLTWRYGHEPLGYRAIVLGTSSAPTGVVIFRVRRRGTALEAVIAELIVPSTNARNRHRLGRAAVRMVLRASGADYAAIVSPAAASLLPVAIPVPRSGPIVTVRDLAQPAPVSVGEFALTLGDIELF